MTRLWMAALAAPVLLHAQGASVGGARPISLAEAVTQAQRNAPAAVQARGTLRTTAAATRSAYGAFVPTVTANIGAANTTGQVNQNGNLVPAGGANPWSSTNGITASVDLFTGFRRLNDLKRAHADENAAEQNETVQKFTVAFSVKQQYFAALSARESEAAAASQVEQAQQQFRAAAARVQAGAATKSDSLRAVILVGNARLAQLTAQNNVRVANAALTRLIASPVPVTPIVADTADPAPIALDSAALGALAESGPTVRQATANLTAAQASARAARSTYLPNVSLAYAVAGSNPSPNFNVGGQYAYRNNLSLAISYPLFNGFVREQTAASTSAAEENAQAALRDGTLFARQVFVQVLGALRTAREQIAIQHASVEAAEEDLRVQTQRYALGASTLLDVLTSQTALNQARAALIQARFDYRNAKAQLEQLVGRDL